MNIEALDFKKGVKEGRKLERAQCEKEIGEILDKFQRSRALDGSMWWRVMPEEDWQALKDKHL